MKNEFIPYEQALELKELGFNEPCFGYFNIDPYLQKPVFNLSKTFEHEWCLPAPTLSQAFRFFREKYGISHEISKTRGGQYMPYVNGDALLDVSTEHKVGNNLIDDKGYQWMYDTYEEAELACLKKLIEIVKQPKKVNL